MKNPWASSVKLLRGSVREQLGYSKHPAKSISRVVLRLVLPRVCRRRTSLCMLDGNSAGGSNSKFCMLAAPRGLAAPRLRENEFGDPPRMCQAQKPTYATKFLDQPERTSRRFAMLKADVNAVPANVRKRSSRLERCTSIR